MYATVIEEPETTILEYDFSSLQDKRKKILLTKHGHVIFGHWMKSLALLNGGYVMTRKPLPNVVREKSVELWIKIPHNPQTCPQKGN